MATGPRPTLKARPVAKVPTVKPAAQPKPVTKSNYGRGLADPKRVSNGIARTKATY
jgi:hypothetical protein